MNLKNYVVSEDMSLIDVLNIIDKNVQKIVFICENDCLKGTVTDGDIRRAILKNHSLNLPVREIANYKPHYVNIKDKVNYKEYMRKHSITSLPIVDDERKIKRIQFQSEKLISDKAKLNIPVVIMAGGKGERLFPYTSILPKPLLPIGNKTITEHIMERFEDFGCEHFDMIVNYKKNLIKAYFMDSENKHQVNFIEEQEFLGTGGGLRMLQGKYDKTFFMSNCDILVEEDYGEIVKLHRDNKNIITIVSAVKNITIPYGTINMTDKGEVSSISEKPQFSFLTNTGFYVIEPEFIDRIPSNQFIHITDIIQNCIDQGDRIGVYPISENSWLDMGQFDEMEKMKSKLIDD